ncbi:MAG: Ig-like domain-containing protein, partial [Dehalococcoidia bacterium]
MVRLNWLAAVAVIGALALGLVMAKPAHADVGTATYSTFVSPPGTTLTQDLLGVIPGGSFTGGVAFAPDGDIWVSECRQGNGDGILYRFDAQTWVPASSMGFGTSEPVHPVVTVGSGLNIGCSLVNHPNGSLYGNSWNGIVRLDAKTGAIIGGPSLGAIADPFPYNVGKTTSIATDPQTGDLYYLTNGDGTGGHALWRANPALTTHTLVSSSAFQPYSDVDGFYFSPDGNFIWAATRDFATSTFAVVKWSRASNAIVDSFPISGAFGEGPDGISFQTTTGYVMTNTVAGSFYAITPTLPASPTNPFQVAPPGSGFRGDLSNVGPDGCIYQTNNLTRFASGLVAGNTSLTRICPNFAPPAGVRQIDLGITAATGPGPFTVGGTVTFNFSASNAVAGTATGVVATLTIPVDLTGCAQTAGTGTYSAGTWTIGTMAPGVTVPMTLTCTLAAAGTQTIDIRIDGNEQDLNQANNTASASVSAAANNPPVAVNDAATTTAGTPVTIAVLGNDSDPDAGDVLTIQSNTTPSNGTATIVSGQIQYTPNPGFTGPTDTFQYTISDGHGGTATATVTVTITVANRPPVARNDVTTNLWAVNPDFEASVAGWGGTLATVTRVTGPACNLASAKVASDPGAPFYRAYGPVGTLSGNTAGRAVTIGGWVRGEGASVGRSFKVFANVFGSGAGAELSASSHTLTAEWQWVSHTAVIAAADQTAIQPFFQREGDPPTSGEYFYL